MLFDDREFKNIWYRQLYFQFEVIEFENFKLCKMEYDKPIWIEVEHRIFRATRIPPNDLYSSETIVFDTFNKQIFFEAFYAIEGGMRKRGYYLSEIRFNTKDLVFERLRPNPPNTDIECFEEDE